MPTPQFLKYHGGKFYLRHWIQSYLPRHQLYVEPFLGGGAVLQTVRGPRIGADIDERLINLWQMLTTSPAFEDTVRRLTYDENTWNCWHERVSPVSDVDAVAKLVSLRFSRGGLGTAFAWSDRLRGGQPGDVNAWENFKSALPQIRDSVREVIFEWQPYQRTFSKYDMPGTCFYCDPPYLPETRTARAAYEHEMTYKQHQELCDYLLACRGTVVISGYANHLYDCEFRNWRRVTKDMPNNSGQGSDKQRRQEVLWIKDNSL